MHRDYTFFFLTLLLIGNFDEFSFCDHTSLVIKIDLTLTISKLYGRTDDNANLLWTRDSLKL